MHRGTAQPGTIPILIVGSGPVGLLLANLLGQQRIPVLLAEQRSAFPDWSRAIGVTPPSLAILQTLGLHEALEQRGVRVEAADVHDDRGLAGRVSFAGIDAEFRHILAVPQCDTMRVLAENLAQFDCVSWRRGWRLVDLDCDADRAVAEFRVLGDGSRRTVSARWVIGCDGADSSVRQLAGIAAKQWRYAPRFVMADYDDGTDLGPRAHLYFTRDGAVESFPLPDRRRRWVVQADGGSAQIDTAAFLEGKVAERTGHALAANAVRSPVFEFAPEAIIVDRIAHGPIFLAGDAAHVMSPIGGQGMNTGFADAELAAAVLPRLLDGARPSPLRVAYEGCRQRAAGSARRRAAFGMWVGTRTGAVASGFRNLALRGFLATPLARHVPPHFAMLTIPCNRACKAPLGEGQP